MLHKHIIRMNDVMGLGRGWWDTNSGEGWIKYWEGWTNCGEGGIKSGESGSSMVRGGPSVRGWD